MKTSHFFLAIALFTGLNLLLARVASSLASGQAASDQEEKKMADQMMKYGTPAREHELLKNYVGEWDVAISAWRSPGSAPETSQGSMRAALLFDGRFLQADFDLMMGGMKARGLEIIGYDLFKKAYTTFWIDSWSTGFVTTSGTLDAAGRVLTETGAYPDVLTDGKTQQAIRNVTTFLGDGKFKFEMFMAMPDGREHKGMELVCTRKRRG